MKCPTCGAEKPVELLPWVEQRRGVKDGKAWVAARLGDGSCYPWKVFWNNESEYCTDEVFESKFVATETFSPDATLAELKRLQDENARLAAKCEELKTSWKQRRA